MDHITNFIASLSSAQWAAVVGLVTWLSHSVLDRNKKLTSELNKFVVRVTTVVLPVATVVAVDPNVMAIVHNYLPALGSFYASYQATYLFWTAFSKKLAEIRSQLQTAATAVVDDPERTAPTI